VDFIDRTGEAFAKGAYRTRLANALHQAGTVKKSKHVFETADRMQRTNQPEYPQLYSIQGFWYCDLLLSAAKYKEVQERASKTLEWVTREHLLLDIALDKLSLGRAYLLETVFEGRREKGEGRTGEWELEVASLAKAADFLNQAVDGLREAGTQHRIPRSFLARAEMYRYQREFGKAWGDLEEAEEIAERGEMNLYMADFHLEAAKLCLAEGRKEKEAREHWTEARERVEKMGYHRRDPEVMLIEAELELAEGNKTKAKQTLKKAKECIDKMGCHRWDIEVEILKDRM
jgi:tetratricopeptide (TPR) repeat protein